LPAWHLLSGTGLKADSCLPPSEARHELVVRCLADFGSKAPVLIPQLRALDSSKHNHSSAKAAEIQHPRTSKTSTSNNHIYNRLAAFSSRKTWKFPRAAGTLPILLETLQYVQRIPISAFV
jgi:hypothetical protein